MHKIVKLTVLLSVLLVALPAMAAKDDSKGHGAGGMRADHASEQGMEHGKAWAGSKEKQAEDEEEVGKKPNKDKKSKKEKNKGK